MEEVVVTARRQAENLQTVPITVSAFNQQALESKGLANLAGLTGYTPNVTLDFTAPITGVVNNVSSWLNNNPPNTATLSG